MCVRRVKENTFSRGPGKTSKKAGKERGEGRRENVGGNRVATAATMTHDYQATWLLL